ncbi:hypothetical protein PV343_13245 [Streptomyces sp. WI03-4A]|uniref:hypothetical protein n=1 Tax=Streptomyces sp. WI03-4A TaxID=3028706 RepID=UPI0029B163A8|nr:hypothetical protein [Streptomyces sp. WI03-4A]MDX2593197.1 hypothetical protein [Streptomyces sp. WI03-4A]
MLCEHFAGPLTRAGIDLSPPTPRVHLGSGFAAAAASERARRVLEAVGEPLACTAGDVLRDAGLRGRAWDGHRRPV